MSGFARIIVCATALCAPMFVATYGAEAFTTGAKSLPNSDATILVRRECTAWRRRPDGTMVCVNWSECTGNVC